MLLRRRGGNAACGSPVAAFCCSALSPSAVAFCRSPRILQMVGREDIPHDRRLPVPPLPADHRAARDAAHCERRDLCVLLLWLLYRLSGKEWEAAWLLIRLGVGGFLSMNIMLFSLLLYSGAFSGVDARLLPWVHLLLWIFATPALVILGGPFLRETWLDGVQGRLRSSALIVVGVGAAYIYSAFAVIERGTHVYFDTATMVLMLFTVGRYLEAAGRARAARDLQPLLAAESEWAEVVNGGAETRRAVRDVKARMLVRVRPGERIS